MLHECRFIAWIPRSGRLPLPAISGCPGILLAEMSFDFY
jgi:hypothetical protein